MTVPCACAPLAMIDTAGFAEKLLVAAVLFVATWLFLWGVIFVAGWAVSPRLRQWLRALRLRALRRRVFAALDDHPWRHAHVDVAVEDFARELVAHEDFEDVSAAWTLVPYIEEWKQQRRRL